MINSKEDYSALLHRNAELDLLKWYYLMEIDMFFAGLNNKSTQQHTPKTLNTMSDKITYAREIADNIKNLSELRNALLDFDLCDLKAGAKNLVLADGNTKSKIMLIGEAPGATEDDKGIPFCGMGGKLLDKGLETINLTREKNVYITNTVFWRPPNNRQPTSQEIEICRPFLEKHIALINPAIIVLVGSVALSTLLGTKALMSKFRHQTHIYSNQYIKNIPITAVFHPAYLLRQPTKKKAFWMDLLYIQSVLKEKELLD